MKGNRSTSGHNGDARCPRCRTALAAGHAVPDNPLPRFVEIKELTRLLSVSKSTVCRMVKKGTFPPSQSISPNRKGWLSTVVDAWLRARAHIRVHHCR